MEIADIPKTVLELLSPYLREGGDSLAFDDSRLDPGDLEISLHRRYGSHYSLETRFTAPGSNTETRLGTSSLVEIDIDEQALEEYGAINDWHEYGRELSAALFEPEPVRLSFMQALSRSGSGALRLRLMFGPSAQKLHKLYWETLQNPLDDTLLAGSQNILFSRYLSGDGARDVYLRPRSALKALVAIANPYNLEAYGLAPVDIEGEITRARMNLKGIHIKTLPAKEERCSLAVLVRHLQAGCDILYLAAHGSLAKGQSWLWLEDESGQVQRVSGDELIAQIRLLDNPPLLAVLISCESAGSGEGDVLQALGPQICEAGVPAVVAMQGKISIESAERSMPVFFDKLQQGGVVDRALAAARATLAAFNAPDLWMPALFMRLKDGSIWKRTGDSAPAALKSLWGAISDSFLGSPAAEGALQDLLANSSDPDNQDAFSIQLKKVLRKDPDFGKQLVSLIETSQKDIGKGQSSGVTIHVGGNVGGSIVLGSNNTIGDIPSR